MNPWSFFAAEPHRPRSGCVMLLPAALLAALAALSACGDRRENDGIGLDRGGHASGEEQGGVIVQKKVGGPNEAYYTMGPDDTLSSVAAAHNVDLGWLIQRNGFTSPPKAGTQVIVPARSTGGGEKRPMAAAARAVGATDDGSGSQEHVFPLEPAPTPVPEKRDLGDGGKKPEPLGAPAVPSDAKPAAPPAPGSGRAEPAAAPAEGEVAARLVIYQGDLSLAVEDVAVAIAAARRLATERGGFLAAMDERTVTLRVPNARFLDAVEASAGLGVVKQRAIRGDDVTAEVVDLRSRLANAESVRVRLVALLDKALRIEDALTIERELARVTEEIERMTGRVQGLEAHAAFATLCLRFQGPDPRVASDAAKPASPLPRAFAWVAALGEEALEGRRDEGYGRGRGPKRSLPAGFVAYAERDGVRRGLSARGVECKLTLNDNHDRAGAAYWGALARRVLADQRGYVIAADAAAPAAGIAWCEASKPVAGATRAYALAIACVRDDVYVLEAWGDPEALAAEREALRAAAAKLARD